MSSDSCAAPTPKPSDRDTLATIHRLIDEEHRLRERLQNHEIDPETEQDRLRAVEVELDRCWDLLRQRRALRDAGNDPRSASIRPADEVEGYLS